MSSAQCNTCTNCKHFDLFDVDYGDTPEDECGICIKTGEFIYGDDFACDEFIELKTIERRKNRRVKDKKLYNQAKRKVKDINYWV